MRVTGKVRSRTACFLSLVTDYADTYAVRPIAGRHLIPMPIHSPNVSHHPYAWMVDNDRTGAMKRILIVVAVVI